VYAAGSTNSSNNGSLAAFERNADGSLVQLPGQAGCIVEQSTDNPDGCGTARNITGAVFSVFVSPDGKGVYAGGGIISSGSVVVFGRNADGSLVQLPGEAGCFVEQGTSNPDGCATARGIVLGIDSVSVSSDGKNLYAGNQNCTLAVFAIS